MNKTTDHYAELKIKQQELGSKYARLIEKTYRDDDTWYRDNVALPAIREAFSQEEDALHQFYGLPARHVRKAND